MAKKTKAVSTAKKPSPKPKPAPIKKAGVTKKTVLTKEKPVLPKKAPAKQAPEKKVGKATPVSAKVQLPKLPIVHAKKVETSIKESQAKELPPMEIEKTPVIKKTKITRAAEAREKAAKQASSDEEARWVDIYEKNKGEKPLDYDMKRQYEANKPLQHKILGWGWILSNENDRLEVLFKDGKKILISNYNS